ncbi:hypothetical protein GF378_03075, partial [Candidatus Pacearchaeota archaeon]|nr:hypothetical protein [Candidatus Pacearchaeota archaeon]
MKIKNKKAQMLPEEVLKLAVSIMSILILGGLLAAYYYTSSSADSLRQAEFELKNGSNSLKAVTNNLESGENTRYSIDQPLGWHFYTFTDPNLDKPSEKPNQCAGFNCVCICKSVWNIVGSVTEEVIEECNENGICLILKELDPVPEEKTEEIKKDPEYGYEIGTINLKIERNEDDSLEIR